MPSEDGKGKTTELTWMEWENKNCKCEASTLQSDLGRLKEEGGVVQRVQELETLAGNLAPAAGPLMINKALKYESDIPHNICPVNIS